MPALLPAPQWAVPVRESFIALLLSGACAPREAWLIFKGAQVSPFQRPLILSKVRSFRYRLRIARLTLWDALTLPFAVWGKFKYVFRTITRVPPAFAEMTAYDTQVARRS
jgi:hypothetical protein